ncbi:ankyrin repeat domain-containing protein [Acidithiobacillus ferriphilus]|uniref:ankyrin repeat domain-containing protein n=1 Tax=Acidithiobacillus ferriphilus TaxID=1689834 RepID=UPI00390CC40B
MCERNFKYARIYLHRFRKKQRFLCLTDKTGYTALHHAARSCSPKCIKLLLEAGASKYVMNENGENGTEYPYDVIGLNLARTVGISNVADLVAECKRLLVTLSASISVDLLYMRT